MPLTQAMLEKILDPLLTLVMGKTRKWKTLSGVVLAGVTWALFYGGIIDNDTANLLWLTAGSIGMFGVGAKAERRANGKS